MPILKTGINVPSSPHSYDANTSTPLQMRFPSQTLRSCWLTVYVLICLFKTWKNMSLSYLMFVLCSDKIDCGSGIQTELGGHCGCNFRHVPASRRTWIFWTISNSIYTTRYSQNSICQQLPTAILWSQSLTLWLCNHFGPQPIPA